MRKNLFVLNLLHLFDDGYEASFLLLLPFLAKELHITLTLVGFLSTLVFACGAILALPSGYFALRFGGMKTLLAGFFIYTLGFIAVSISPFFALVALAFVLGGIGFGIFHPIGFSLAAKWASKEKRGSAMGNFTAIGDIGRIGTSAVLTFLVVSIGWRKVSLLFGLIALLVGAFITLFLLYRARKETSLAKEVTPAESLSLIAILKKRRFIFASLASFFDTFASSSLFVFLPFLLLKRGIHPSLLGTFAAVFFIGNILGKALLGKSVDKFENAKVFIASELLMALLIFILANTTQTIFILASSLALGIFTKGTVPVLQTMITDAIEHEGSFEKGFGINALTANAALTVAPITLGFLSDKLTVVSAFNVMALFALFAIVPALLFHMKKSI